MLDSQGHTEQGVKKSAIKVYLSLLHNLEELGYIVQGVSIPLPPPSTAELGSDI